MKKNNQYTSSEYFKTDDSHSKKLRTKLSEKKQIHSQAHLNKILARNIVTTKIEKDKQQQCKKQEAAKNKIKTKYLIKEKSKSKKVTQMSLHYSKTNDKGNELTNRQKYNRQNQLLHSSKTKKLILLATKKKQRSSKKQQNSKQKYGKHLLLQSQKESVQDKIESIADIILASQSPKNQRFDKFQIRSAKYSKMLQQLKASQEHRISLNSPKPRSLYKKRVEKLNQQIERYKNLNSRSEEALKKMKKVQFDQQCEFDKKKCAYLNEIKKLKQQLAEYRPNIGHLFSFKEYDLQSLIPNQMILDRNDESIEQRDSTIERKQPINIECQRLIDHYLQEQQSRFNESSVDELCLSIRSKESDQE